MSLRSPFGVIAYRMQGEVFVRDSKYRESTATVVCVGKTKYIMNKIILASMMNEFEVPIQAFGSPLKEGYNRLLQTVLSCHEYIGLIGSLCLSKLCRAASPPAD